jgi:signal transduction histidine kinase
VLYRTAQEALTNIRKHAHAALKITYSSHKFPVRWLSVLARGINFFRTRSSVV